MPERGWRDEGGCCSLLTAPLEEAEAEALAAAFRALADPARLRLLSLIAAQPGGGCACDLVEPLGRSQPTVSHHLKVLFEAGLVSRERRGPWVWYRAQPGRLEALRAVLAPRPAPRRPPRKGPSPEGSVRPVGAKG